MSRQRSRRQKYRRYSPSIPEKANHVLNLVLIALVVFSIRIWYLAVVQHEERSEASSRPQRRVVIEPAERGTIRDRFNIPLALNRVQYNAAILYSQILEIPRIAWGKDSQGKKTRVYKRKEHIEQVAHFMGDVLNVSAQHIEDLIYSKGAIFPNAPLVIKSSISEQEYFRLKMLEKDWAGIQALISPHRFYPQERVASDIVGYLGAISRDTYDQVAGEIEELGEYIRQNELGEFPPLPKGITSPLEAEHRLKDLQEKAYTINDDVGKAGIEKVYEESLRGYYGKKTYLADARGNFLRELPDARKPLAGQRILLSISSELQEFAEKLLIENERIRDGTSRQLDRETGRITRLKQPWIKGGAIIALEPNTGEVLALATCPRYDPNDFISSGDLEVDAEKRHNIFRWFETDSHIGDVWDQEVPLKREVLTADSWEAQDEGEYLTWDNYLSFILPEGSPVIENMGQTIIHAVELQRCFVALLKLSGQDNPWALLNALYSAEPYRDVPHHIKQGILKTLEASEKQSRPLKNMLNSYVGALPNNYDKLLTIDLCRLVVCDTFFNQGLLDLVQNQSLSFYRDVSAAKENVAHFIKFETRKLFHELNFQEWRVAHLKEFLKAKRQEEKENKRYARPFIDYVEREEELQFQVFWNQHKEALLAVLLIGETGFPSLSSPDMEPYANYFLSWHDELERGAHVALPWRSHYVVLRESLRELGPVTALQYFQTMRGFEDLKRPLWGYYRNVRSQKGMQNEQDLAAAFYPLNGFGYGRSYAYRQAITQGSIFKVVPSYEALVQRYYKLNGKYNNIMDLNPLTITDRVHRTQGSNSPLLIGYAADGQPIPQMYKGGRLLPSLRKNIGEINILRALEYSSNPYFSLLASEVIETPQDLNKAATMFSYGHPTGIELPGEYGGSLPQDLEFNRSGLYSYACGQHTLVVTPLQTAVMLSSIANGGDVLRPQLVRMMAGKKPLRSGEGGQQQIRVVSPETKNQIALPADVRTLLLRGLDQVIHGRHDSIINNYRNYPEYMRDYEHFKGDIVGKSSTGETIERVDVDFKLGTNLYNYIWFACISFDPETRYAASDKQDYFGKFGKPELVVIVVLRYGNYGKETAPVATQIIKKWREIKKKYNS